IDRFLMDLLGEAGPVPDYYLNFGQGNSRDTPPWGVFIEFASNDSRFTEEAVAALLAHIIEEFNSRYQGEWRIDGNIGALEIEHPRYVFLWEELLYNFGFSLLLYLITLLILFFLRKKLSFFRGTIKLTLLEVIVFLGVAGLFMESRLFSPSYYLYKRSNEYFRIEQHLNIREPDSLQEEGVYRWESYPETLEFMEALEQPGPLDKEKFLWWVNRVSSFKPEEELFSVNFSMDSFDLEGTYKKGNGSSTVYSLEPIVPRRNYYKHLSEDQREWMDWYFQKSLNLYTAWLAEQGIMAEPAEEPRFIGAYPGKPWADYYIQVFAVFYLIINSLFLLTVFKKNSRKNPAAS
ncbi:MAG: hypothetical protein PQJ50_00465, partial [Spirochaetales bacterium]|nr:hypothetical protein [Spirochaetales bacterium]